MIAPDGLVYTVPDEWRFMDLDWIKKNIFTDDPPNGIISISTWQGQSFTCLRNGDENGSEDDLNVPRYSGLISVDSKSFQQPVASFSCLGFFFEKGVHPNDAADAFVNNCSSMTILDWTDETYMELTPSQKKKVWEYYATDDLGGVDKPRSAVLTHRHCFPKPPTGFSLIENASVSNHYIWHSPGFLLAKLGDKYVLLGQDDDQYFGCTLPHAVDTIDEAFNCLIPTEAKGKKFVRQGEWFVVSVNAADVPNHNERLLWGMSNELIILPKDDEDSENHIVACKEFVLGLNGTLFVYDPLVEHSQHNDVKSKGWNAFYRNTALESFSVRGMD